MVTRKDGQTRGKYTLELKMEAVRLVEGGQANAVAAVLSAYDFHEHSQILNTENCAIVAPMVYLTSMVQHKLRYVQSRL
jgi:hypothetical protein